MKKNIKIRNCEDEKFEVKIDDFEDVEKLECEVWWGNEVLKIYYKNGKVTRIDTSDCPGIPNIDEYYGSYAISLDKIDEFSNYTSSHEGLDKNNGWY